MHLKIANGWVEYKVPTGPMNNSKHEKRLVSKVK